MIFMGVCLAIAGTLIGLVALAVATDLKVPLWRPVVIGMIAGSLFALGLFVASQEVPGSHPPCTTVR